MYTHYEWHARVSHATILHLFNNRAAEEGHFFKVFDPLSVELQSALARSGSGLEICTAGREGGTHPNERASSS